jgi:hypothetical protein
MEAILEASNNLWDYKTYLATGVIPVIFKQVTSTAAYHTWTSPGMKQII